MTETQSNDTQPTSPPAGWYPDPDGANCKRWWDGKQWTNRVDDYTAGNISDFPDPSNVNPLDDYPALKSWKTSISLSILGAVAWIAVWSFLYYSVYLILSVVVSSSGMGVFAGPGTLVIFEVLSIVYAFVFYPSYYKERPLLKSSKAISFMNLFFGGWLFGSLWNHNLTRSHTLERPEKGTSYIVSAVFNMLSILYFAFYMFNSGIVLADHYQNSNSYPSYNSIERQYQNSGEPSAANRIENIEQGISYTIPAGWKSVPVSNADNPEAVIAELNPTNTNRIAVGIVRDGEMTPELFNSITAEYVESLFGDGLTEWESSGASKVVLGDNEYWSIEGHGVYDTPYGKQTIHLAYWFTAQNGYMYSFQLNDYIANEQSAPYVDDVVELIASAEYA